MFRTIPDIGNTKAFLIDDKKRESLACFFSQEPAQKNFSSPLLCVFVEFHLRTKHLYHKLEELNSLTHPFC